MIGIYKITNPDGLVYIGASTNIEKRKSYYNSISSRLQTKLYESIMKYGFNKHLFDVLEICNKSQLNEKECFYAIKYDVLNNGLNSVIPLMGVSESTKEKMSKSKIGSLNHFFGKKHSKESAIKISESNKGKILSNKHRELLSKNASKHNSKMVVDLNIGIYYDSAKDVSDVYGINYSTLRSMLNGTNKNKSQFAYC